MKSFKTHLKLNESRDKELDKELAHLSQDLSFLKSDKLTKIIMNLLYQHISDKDRKKVLDEIKKKYNIK